MPVLGQGITSNLFMLCTCLAAVGTTFNIFSYNAVFGNFKPITFPTTSRFAMCLCVLKKYKVLKTHKLVRIFNKRYKKYNKWLILFGELNLIIYFSTSVMYNVKPQNPNCSPKPRYLCAVS